MLAASLRHGRPTFQSTYYVGFMRTATDECGQCTLRNPRRVSGLADDSGRLRMHRSGKPLPFFFGVFRPMLSACVGTEAAIRTERLILSPLGPEHAGALFPLLNEWEVARMLAE